MDAPEGLDAVSPCVTRCKENNGGIGRKIVHRRQFHALTWRELPVIRARDSTVHCDGRIARVAEAETNCRLSCWVQAGMPYFGGVEILPARPSRPFSLA